MKKKALVLGGGGFIGSNLVNYLKKKGYFVKAVDLKYPEFAETKADEFIIGDLRKLFICRKVIENSFSEIYQLAADMGGARYTFSGENDTKIVQNSALINLNVAKTLNKNKFPGIFFFPSSACVYPKQNQKDAHRPNCTEETAYPADPDSEYGWEKLFSERLYQSCMRNFGLNIRIARFHNVYGPLGIYDGGKEKAPAAICRKVALSQDGELIEIWGDGKQTRSFLYIDECLKGMQKLIRSKFQEPINIGSDRMVTINQLAKIAVKISSKNVRLTHVPGVQGVRGRNSDNKLIKKVLKWAPSNDLERGMTKTYRWILSEIRKKHGSQNS